MSGRPPPDVCCGNHLNLTRGSQAELPTADLDDGFKLGSTAARDAACALEIRHGPADTVDTGKPEPPA
jgi:hypothetical protein